jgi:hypothetical protein
MDVACSTGQLFLSNKILINFLDPRSCQSKSWLLQITIFGNRTPHQSRVFLHGCCNVWGYVQSERMLFIAEQRILYKSHGRPFDTPNGFEQIGYQHYDWIDESDDCILWDRVIKWTFYFIHHNVLVSVSTTNSCILFWLSGTQAQWRNSINSKRLLTWLIQVYKYSSIHEIMLFRTWTHSHYSAVVDKVRSSYLTVIKSSFSCPDPMSRCKMLFRCTHIGYKNISDLNPYVISRQIFIPFLGKLLNPNAINYILFRTSTLEISNKCSATENSIRGRYVEQLWRFDEGYMADLLQFAQRHQRKANGYTGYSERHVWVSFLFDLPNPS